MERMKQSLRDGISIYLFPEGTRNKTNEPLKNFYDGAFKLAVATNAAISPAVLFNTRKSLPGNKFFYFLPYTLKIHFLEPVSPGTQTAEQLKEKVFTIMKEYYCLGNH